MPRLRSGAVTGGTEVTVRPVIAEEENNVRLVKVKKSGGDGGDRKKGRAKPIVEGKEVTTTAARVEEVTVTPTGILPGRTRRKAGGDGVAVSENKKKEVIEATKRISPGKRGAQPEVDKKTIKKTKFPDRLHWKMQHLSMPATSTPIRTATTTQSTKLSKEDIETAFGFDETLEEETTPANYSTFLSPIAHAGDRNCIIPQTYKIHPLTQRNIEPEPEVVPPPTPAAPVKKAKTKATSSKSKKAGKPPKSTSSAQPEHLERRKPHLFPKQETTGVEILRKGTGESPFSQLLHKYQEDDDNEELAELKVDPKKIIRTYGSRKRIAYSEERDSEAEYDFVPKVIKERSPEDAAVAVVPSKQKRKKKVGDKKKRKGKRNAGQESDGENAEDLDEEAGQRLEEIQKEFEQVEKVKLVIEQSFSD